MSLPRKRKPLIDRFNKYVSPCPNTGCWFWLGAGAWSGYGYGRLRLGGKEEGMINAHVFSYQTFVGEVPDGLVVRHHCDNPLCVNPDHLAVGTQKDNVADAMRRGRMKRLFKRGFNPARGTGKARKLTDEQALTIRSSKAATSELAARYGVCRSTIIKIRNGTLRPNIKKEDQYVSPQKHV